jgi:uncharacterized Tic20 family protein
MPTSDELNNLETSAPPSLEDAKARAAKKVEEARQWAMFIHLSLLAGFVVPFGGLVAPIVLWQVKKDEMPGIDEHGKNAVNWMISHIIYIAISIVLILVVVGIFTLIAVCVVGVIFPIIAGIKASKGEVWRYPMAIRFIK